MKGIGVWPWSGWSSLAFEATFLLMLDGIPGLKTVRPRRYRLVDRCQSSVGTGDQSVNTDVWAYGISRNFGEEPHQGDERAIRLRITAEHKSLSRICLYSAVWELIVILISQLLTTACRHTLMSIPAAINSVR